MQITNISVLRTWWESYPVFFYKDFSATHLEKSILFFSTKVLVLCTFLEIHPAFLRTLVGIHFYKDFSATHLFGNTSCFSMHFGWNSFLQRFQCYAPFWKYILLFYAPWSEFNLIFSNIRILSNLQKKL